jgi:dolichol-phosphate mannosyltransferase
MVSKEHNLKKYNKEYPVENKQWELPKFNFKEFFSKKQQYCLCIYVINEGERIQNQLRKIKKNNISGLVDIIIADGGSTDGSLNETFLKSVGVRTLLTLKGKPGLATQMRIGMAYALQEGYDKLIFMDGNDKDDVKVIRKFVAALNKGYEHVQASRFMKGGKSINLPFYRDWPLKLIHIPLLSLAARHRFTDTTYGFRGYTKEFLLDSRIQPLRNVFTDYELHYYLALKAARLGYKIIEVPSTRAYPKNGKIPTKISFFRGNFLIIRNLLGVCFGMYNPKNKKQSKNHKK